MKKIVFLILVVVAATACDDDNDDRNNSAQKIQEIKDDVMEGQWRVTYFYDTDHDETSVFNGYTFQFAETGTLTATNSMSTHTGTWSVTDSNSSDDDDSLDDLDFNIVFTSPAEFEEISDDWDIISQSDTKIELRDVSGGNGGTDYLTFEKL
jgi:hypothetical protein